MGWVDIAAFALTSIGHQDPTRVLLRKEKKQEDYELTQFMRFGIIIRSVQIGLNFFELTQDA